MSSHSSRGIPAGFLREYRLLTTFLALIPSCCCDFRRGETAGEPTLLFPIVLPIAALIISAFQKIVIPGVLLRRAFNLECVLDTPVGSIASSAVEYTPERAQCQYLVAIFFCSSIECILPRIYANFGWFISRCRCLIKATRNCRCRGCDCRAR